MSRVDVLIVGGGLVGLSLASSIRASGLSIVLLDAGPVPEFARPPAPTFEGSTLKSGFAPRVSAINPASKDFLSRVKGWPTETLDRVCAFDGMLVWDAMGTARIEFDASLTDDPHLGFVIENANLLASLYLGATGNPDLELRFDSAIREISRADGGYIVLLENGEQFECELLVGADGGNSIVRSACGLRTLSWQYGQDALVTTVMTERPHEGVARQCFTPHGPLAFLPLAAEGQNLCSIVWSSDIKETLMAAGDADFCERLTAASESVLGKVVATDKRYAFPLRQQHALRYVRPHLALVGDAAHTIHPLAGQGANLGLADAEALSVALNECRFSGESPGDMQLLRRYQARRQPANVLVTLVMEAFKRMYQPGPPLLTWLRNAGTRFVNRTPPLKSLVIRLAAGR